MYVWKKLNVFIFFNYSNRYFIHLKSFLGFFFFNSSFFDVWSKNVFLQLKSRLSGFAILSLIACKHGWILYFEIIASIRSKRFKLETFAFFFGKFSLVRPQLVKNLVIVIYFFEAKMRDAVIINYWLLL